jgi:hypothetical protein
MGIAYRILIPDKGLSNRGNMPVSRDEKRCQNEESRLESVNVWCKGRGQLSQKQLGFFTDLETTLGNPGNLKPVDESICGRCKSQREGLQHMDHVCADDQVICSDISGVVISAEICGA